MDEVSSPPLKRKRNELLFELCLTCQKETEESLRHPKDIESVDKIIHTISLRASLGNTQLIILKKKIDSFSSEELLSNKCGLHKTCYSSLTSPTHLKRDEKRHQRARTAKNPLLLKPKVGRPSQSVGQGDCPNLQKLNENETQKLLSCEAQFFSDLKERIQEGEVIGMDLIEKEYEKREDLKPSSSNSRLQRKSLSEKLMHHIEKLKITPHPDRNKPPLVHSEIVGQEAVQDKAGNVCNEMDIVFKACMIVRKAIEEKKKSPWIFEGNFEKVDQTVPDQLQRMVSWIIYGPYPQDTEERPVEKSARVIAHQMVQAHKSKRQVMRNSRHMQGLVSNEEGNPGFRTKVDTPMTLGVSLYCHYFWRSQKLNTLLSHAGVGVPYKRVKQCVAQIAQGVHENIEKYGVYIPPRLHNHSSLRFSIDNIDAQVDTPDGKNSFHATAMTVYQRQPEADIVTVDYVSEKIQLNNNRLPSMGHAPNTVIPLIQSSISGSPLPQNSPHYPNFTVALNPSGITELSDLVWLLARSYTRNNNNIHIGCQTIPVWSAHNSILSPRITQLDEAHALPLLNAPAHEWSSLVTTLDQLIKLNAIADTDETPVLLWADMDLYKRIRKLLVIEPQFHGKVVASPGPFHVVLCALRCLGATMDSSGLDEAWVEVDLYSSVTVTQILNGNHHNRALDAHQITLQVLFELWIDAIFKSDPALKKSLMKGIEELVIAYGTRTNVIQTYNKVLKVFERIKFQQRVKEFDEKNESFPMYKYTRTYMNQVLNLLQFVHATRSRNWVSYLEALEKMCIYFFAYNRHDYAQNIPEYIALMKSLRQSLPEVWREFEAGGFTVTKNSTPFTSVGPDQAQEYMNKVHKGDGALSGIMTNPDAILKYCLSAPELSRIIEEIEEKLNIKPETTKQHHRDNSARLESQESAVDQLKEVLKRCNPFSILECSDGTEYKLYNIITNTIMPDNIQADIIGMEERGRSAYIQFVEERISGEKNLWDKMKKVKFLNWTDASKKVKHASQSQEGLKSSTSFFVRLLLIAKSSRDLQLDKIIGKYEFSPISAPLIKADGNLHQCNDKAKLTAALESIISNTTEPQVSSTQAEANTTQAVIFDGMAIVHEAFAQKGKIKTCKDLADILVEMTESKAKKYKEAYVMFDDYGKVDSLKDQTRHTRTAGNSNRLGHKVEDTTKIKDLKSFLCSKETKHQLVPYLAKKLVTQMKMDVTIHTPGGVMSSNQNMLKIHSTQEEGDTLVIFYASELYKSAKTVHIYSSDTDVLVLAIRRAPQLGPEAAIITGTGSRRRLLNLKLIYDALGPVKAAALPGMHALTGSDCTGHIHGKGKASCFKAFMSTGEDVLEALTLLGTGPQPSPEVMTGCEKFLCQLYSQSASLASELRWQYFKELPHNQGVEKLPPTQGAITQHILRAHYQANVWIQDLVQKPILLDPTSLGWRKYENTFKPVVTVLPPAPDAVIELVKCRCQTSRCSGRCTCKQHNLPCTELCRCGGDDSDMCQNKISNDSDDNSSDEDN